MRTFRRATVLALVVYFGLYPFLWGLAAFLFWLADRLEG